MPLFSSPFVRLSFAPEPSSFALLKTIVRPGKLILRNHLRWGGRRLRATEFVVSQVPKSGPGAPGASSFVLLKTYYAPREVNSK